MKQKEGIRSKFVVCINNKEYPASLELHKIYRVLSDADAEEDGDLRIIDESGEDYLYPAEWFVQNSLPHEVEMSIIHITKKRNYPKFGSAKRLIEVPDSFDDPLEDFEEYMQ